MLLTRDLAGRQPNPGFRVAVAGDRELARDAG